MKFNRFARKVLVLVLFTASGVLAWSWPPIVIPKLYLIRYVDDGYTSTNCDGKDWGKNAFDNIQDAIDEANATNTIIVAPGTYAENVVISKHIWLVGAGSGSTTVSPTSGDAISLRKGGKTLLRLRIQGLKLSAPGAGIAIPGGTAGSPMKIKHVVVEGVAIVDCGAQGIRVGDYTTLKNFTVKKSAITNIGANRQSADGIEIAGHTSVKDLSIESCTVTGNASGAGLQCR